jgi:hypothetical protein
MIFKATLIYNEVPQLFKIEIKSYNVNDDIKYKNNNTILYDMTENETYKNNKIVLSEDITDDIIYENNKVLLSLLLLNLSQKNTLNILNITKVLILGVENVLKLIFIELIELMETYKNNGIYHNNKVQFNNMWLYLCSIRSITIIKIL